MTNAFQMDLMLALLYCREMLKFARQIETNPHALHKETFYINDGKRKRMTEIQRSAE